MDSLESAVDFVASLSVLESVLLIVGIILIWRGIVQMSRLVKGSPGPVSIGDFVDGAKVEANVKQLTELVRERLSATGLFPPTTPVGSASEAITAAVKAVPIAQTRWLAEFIKHIPGLLRPRYGHTVRGTAWTGQGDELTLALEISEVPGGSVERAVVVEGAADDVVQRAAAEIYYEVTMHPRVWRKLKPWERWSSSGGEGLAALHTGLALDDRGEFEAAVENYRRAVAVEPSNAVARLQLANSLETAAASRPTARATLDDLLEASELYRLTGALWPKLWEASYRFATVLSFLPLWTKGWGTPPTAAQRNRFRELLGLSQLPGDEVPESILLDESLAAWGRLEPVPDDMEKVVGLAKACTRAQKAIHEEDAPLLESVVGQAAEKIKRGSHWARRYNAVCLYSFGTAPILASEKQTANGAAALRLLDELLSGEPDFRVDMARGDPDLTHLETWLSAVPSSPPPLGLPRSFPFWKRALAAA